MSNVPKSRRKKHDFEAAKEMKALRKDMTEIIINDFGYDAERYQRMIDRYLEAHKNNVNIEQSISRMQIKHDGFYEKFIEKETADVLNMWRNIVSEFEMGNSIFPSGETKFAEYCERRLHFDRCVGHLKTLRAEMQYIAETLPVDKNKYDNLGERIKSLTAIVKGVRQASNKFLKAKTGRPD